MKVNKILMHMFPSEVVWVV